MSLASCEKCWDQPCTCGWQYRYLKDEGLYQLINKFIKTLNESNSLDFILDKIKTDAEASGIQ